ncbi:MAG TPA: CBS domain-containing protein, partial [Rheinheimera sp.]|nr:CBS domain-containing protein [Rheinheimera sp.]
RGEQVPIVAQTATIKDALLEISQKGLGMTAVVDEDGNMAGVFTDGDLRRILDQRYDIHSSLIAEVMTKNCITAQAQQLAAEALQIMQQKKINGLIIIDAAGKPVGAMNMHDLLRAGVL